MSYPSGGQLVQYNSVTATEVLVRSGAIILTSVKSLNTEVAASYLQLFDARTLAEVTVGTTVPTWVIKAEASDPSLGDGVPSDGLRFDHGLVIASTTTMTGSTGATQHVRITIG